MIMLLSSRRFPHLLSSSPLIFPSLSESYDRFPLRRFSKRNESCSSSCFRCWWRSKDYLFYWEIDWRCFLTYRYGIRGRPILSSISLHPFLLQGALLSLASPMKRAENEVIEVIVSARDEGGLKGTTVVEVSYPILPYSISSLHRFM